MAQQRNAINVLINVTKYNSANRRLKRFKKWERATYQLGQLTKCPLLMFCSVNKQFIRANSYEAIPPPPADIHC